MKRKITLILSVLLILSGFTGCTKETNNNDTSKIGQIENVQLNENDKTESLNEGEFNPLSIVKEEFIRYDMPKNGCYSGHYYNGGGTANVSFPEGFEVEIIPGLYLVRSSGNASLEYNSQLSVIANNQFLGSIEYYFVGETLKYNDINKLSKGDVIKLGVRECDKSGRLNDNLAANGFSMVDIPIFITVPDLGELITANDTITNEDIYNIISLANPEKETYWADFTYSEKPIRIYKGVVKSQTVIGDAIVLKLVYERTLESGYTSLIVLTTCDLAKHDDKPATCTFKMESNDGFKNDASESDMISVWSKDYIWERIDY